MSIETKRKKILGGNLWSLVLFLGFPIAINSVLTSVYGMIDTGFASNIAGKDGLSGIGFVEPIIGIFYALCGAVGVCSSIFITRNIARNTYTNAKKYLSLSVILVMSVGLVLALFGFLFAHQIVSLLNANERYFDLSVQYLRLQSLFIPFKFFGDIFLSVKKAEGRTLYGMLVNVGSMCLKLILLIIFFYSGARGIHLLSLTTLAAYLFVFAFGIYEFFIKNNELKIRFADFKIDKKTIVIPFLIMLVPILIEKTSLNIGHVIVQSFITDYDPAVLTGYSLTNRINNILYALGTGFGVALITIVGQNLAVGNIKRAKRSVLVASVIATISVSVVLAVVFIFQDQILRIFTSDPDEIYHTKNAMLFISTTSIPWIFLQLAIGVFSAAKRPGYTIVISFVRLFVIRIPLLYLLITFTNLQEWSIWITMGISNVLAALLAIILYFKIKWEFPKPSIVKLESIQG